VDRIIKSGQRIKLRFKDAVPEWIKACGDDWHLSIMDWTLTDRLHRKQGRSIARYTLSPELVVYIKRVESSPRSTGLLARLFPRRCWSSSVHEWHNLKLARRLGFNTPRPVAVAELLTDGWNLQSVLAIEELHDMQPLHLAIPYAEQHLSYGVFAEWKRTLLLAIVRLLQSLHRRSYFHKDMYLCHLYVHQCCLDRIPENWDRELHLIDFHRFARHPLTGLWWRLKDLSQLLFSMHTPGLTAEDRLFVLRQYLDGMGWFARPLIRWVVGLRIRNYLQHQLKSRG
jgi:hypothetical protein